MAEEAAVSLYRSFVEKDPARAIDVIERAKAGGMTREQLFGALFVPALTLLGQSWAEGGIDELAFMQAAVVAEQVTSFVIPSATAPDRGVVVLVGSMHRDTHSVAKDIAGGDLKEAGWRVIDLGADVRPADFLEKAEETGARILLVFAEMTTTARAVVGVREVFAAEGREDVVILVGGGPFEADRKLARVVGANGVVRGAESALRLVRRVARDLFGEARS